MTGNIRIEGSGDCGNSPKNRLAQDIAIGLENGDLDAELLADDVIWRTASGAVIKGAAAVVAAVRKADRPSDITVDHAISHGKVGAANGITGLSGGKMRGFAHMIGFTSTSAKKIEAISSYYTG
ncbi:hypothetical protein [Paracoccus aerodenitrificans]|uniref:hypothetical protein n=1 Tax=Paracoccus aerodenitrificans TaxID=3017781 RepID=UPI0022F048FE|nr:hypothetical protein [Paracoccus aerodenitrificans]WBU64066.1 hypothetical protein PAE61_17335 [Paracoccus aerodenitrificans]